MNDKIKLIDVGARGGINPRWKPHYGMLEVLAFEPDPDECAALNSECHPYSIQFLPAALGAQDGQQAILFICRQPGCSSLLKPNMELCSMYPYSKAMEVVGEYPITLKRMDTVCQDFQADVMKIDTQGTELDVLRGAGRLLDSVLAVELEVEFVPQYHGQSLFSDVDFFMRQQGFTLRGLRRSYWRTRGVPMHSHGGQIIHGDALYLRPDRMNCQKGHIILSAYRQYDLLAHFGASHLIPRKSLFLRLASKLLSRYPNRDLRRLVDLLRPADATDWHDPDFF
ncbi:MAG: FkbM family methyltransferase [Candidatus Methylumidiphilus sp.]